MNTTKDKLLPLTCKKAACDQCQMVTINGVPCHESGCPNTPVGTCDRCGGPITKAGGTWANSESEWTGQYFCCETCADCVCEDE